MSAYFYHLSFELYRAGEGPLDDAEPAPPHHPLSPPQPLELFANPVPRPYRLAEITGARSEEEPDVSIPTLSDKQSLANSSLSTKLSGRRPDDEPLSASDEQSEHHERPSTHATRDWRFDRISIESIDMLPAASPARHSSTRHAKSSSKNNGAMEAGTDGFAAKGKFVPLGSENTDLGWGIVHLYRDGEESPGLYDDGTESYSKSVAKRGTGRRLDVSRREEVMKEDCTTLCILAVPSYLTPSDFLGFVGEKTTSEVSHFRMVRTERINRYMVLMKFRDSRRARAWRKEWNGKPFNSMEVRTFKFPCLMSPTLIHEWIARILSRCLYQVDTVSNPERWRGLLHVSEHHERPSHAAAAAGSGKIGCPEHFCRLNDAVQVSTLQFLNETGGSTHAVVDRAADVSSLS